MRPRRKGLFGALIAVATFAIVVVATRQDDAERRGYIGAMPPVRCVASTTGTEVIAPMMMLPGSEWGWRIWIEDRCWTVAGDPGRIRFATCACTSAMVADCEAGDVVCGA